MMTVRVSMDDLILQVRTLIGDPAGDDQVFSSQEIQNAMDTHRWEARYMPLKPIVSYLPGGIAEYLTWIAPVGNWEGGVTLVDAQYVEVMPSVSDYLSGRWTFETTQNSVWLSGWFYDLYGASADLLEAWAAKSASDYDFTADGSSFHRSQKGESLRKLAQEYRKKQQINVIPQERSDLAYDY